MVSNTVSTLQSHQINGQAIERYILYSLFTFNFICGGMDLTNKAVFTKKRRHATQGCR